MLEEDQSITDEFNFFSFVDWNNLSDFAHKKECLREAKKCFERRRRRGSACSNVCEHCNAYMDLISRKVGNTRNAAKNRENL